VVSTKLFAGQTVARIYGETCPGAGFEPSAASLEDVYFTAMARHTGTRAAEAPRA
jgi:ABC-2 type transport system ATP-binding protein